MNKMRLITHIIDIVLGTVLVICGCMELFDSFWSGMGGALIGVGLIRLIQDLRYRSDAEYKERYDLELKDERNSFLRVKAWSWAGYLFVLIAAVSAIVFKLVGRDELMMLCSTSVCLILVLYWVSYMILKKKY